MNYEKVVGVRLSKNDLERLKSKAFNERLPLSSYLRNKLTKGL